MYYKLSVDPAPVETIILRLNKMEFINGPAAKLLRWSKVGLSGNDSIGQSFSIVSICILNSSQSFAKQGPIGEHY